MIYMYTENTELSYMIGTKSFQYEPEFDKYLASILHRRPSIAIATSNNERTQLPSTLLSSTCRRIYIYIMNMDIEEREKG